MASLDQLQSYHPQCSSIEFNSFRLVRSIEYDPGDDEYYNDLVKDNGKEGIVLGAICFLIFLAIILFCVVTCCFAHHWLDHCNFLAVARKGDGWLKRLLALLFVLGIVACTVLITAMSIWGIYEVEDKAKKVVPDTFDFVERTEDQIDSIHSNLTLAVDNGNEIITQVRRAIQEIRRDPATELLARSGDLKTIFEELLSSLETALKDGKDALDRVDEEVNDNLSELLDALREALEYRDESEDINTTTRIVAIVCFVLFIFFAVLSTVFSLLGVSAGCTLTWAVLMWLLLSQSFIWVNVLDVFKEISKESCLYLDTFAVDELRGEIKSDPDRAEQLLWYYFRPPGAEKKTLDELQDLWGFPLQTVENFLDQAEIEIFEGDGLKSPYNTVSNRTSDALFAVRDLIPQARDDIDYVQELITGDTLHNIHVDFKDLLCCTEYDALDSIWEAWVVSSAFGLLIATLMTIQGFISFRFGRPKAGSASMNRLTTQKNSAYMGPPVAEGVYDSKPQESYGSGVPLRGNKQQSTAMYPEVRAPTL